MPDDRVLVGVIRRKRDLTYLLRDHWYRVPVFAAPGCVDTIFMAFFTDGAIRYYARLTGFELFRRRDLLPLEYKHPRANELYFKLQFRDVIACEPPISNQERRAFAFIFTDWAHFEAARSVRELTIRDETVKRTQSGG